MNKVILIGNLTRDPEHRTTQSGTSQCSFTLAVERDRAKAQDGKKPVDFITVIAWRNTADLCARYLTKGRQVAVVGVWQNREYEKDGIKRYVSECIADDVQFLGSPRKENAPVDDDYPFPDE